MPPAGDSDEFEISMAAVEASGSLRTAEQQRLIEALSRSGGNKAEAARLLGLPRSTFFSKLKKFGIE